MAVSRIAKDISKRCYNGSRLSHRVMIGVVVVVISLVLELTAGQNDGPPADDINKTGENRTETPGSGLDLDPHDRTSPSKELELTMTRDQNLTVHMDGDSVLGASVTLRCSHPSVAYTITITSDNARVAAVDDFQAFNISCAAAPPSGEGRRNASELDATASSEARSVQPGKEELALLSSLVPVVEGAFNFTLRGGILGRAWLHISVQRYADPGVVLPIFLALPWNTTTGEEASGSGTSQQGRGIESPSDDLPGNTVLEYDEGGAGGDEGYEAHYRIAPQADRGAMKQTEVEIQKHLVTVLRVSRPIDIAFRAVLYGFVVLATIGMGCKTDVAVVKEVLKKPVAPAIGFVCQYVFMPLIAFLLAKTVVLGDPAVSLGIFTCGICPGGGPSNMYSYLLDGDVSLSVTMTAVSTVAALAMIPAWLFTLGALFEDDKISLKVPFGQIFMTLAFIIIPLFVGLAIKRYAPKVAKWILKVLKPFTLVAILFLLTLGVYANLYVFRLFSARTLLAGCLLPYIGYVLGGLISLLLRQPCYRVKTIAIETGIQNTSIAYLLLIFSLPAPDGDMAAVGPVASAVMTPLPLFLLVIVYLTYKRCTKKKKKKKGEREAEEGKKGGGGRRGKEGGGEEEVALREKEEKKEKEEEERDGSSAAADEKNGNAEKV